MSSVPSKPSEFGWPWPFQWPTTDLGAAIPWFAPERLAQAINPGWTFENVTVNNDNSSGPDVEHYVVSRYSYGRQIGRMMEALETLIAAQPAAVKEKLAVKQFVELAREVADAKKAGESQQRDRLLRELTALKRDDYKTWKWLFDMS